MRRGSDDGGATVWAVACCVLVLLVGAFAMARAAAVVARHRAEGAADLAALAAAGRIGVGTDGCAAARRIAARNSAHLVSCRLRLAADGRSGEVRVVVASGVRLPFAGAQQVRASARAGRLPASAERYSVVVPADASSGPR